MIYFIEPCLRDFRVKLQKQNGEGFWKRLSDRLESAAAAGDLEQETKRQAGLLVGALIAITPPGKGRGSTISDRGGITLDAKKMGESQVKSDIQKLFPTTAIKEVPKIEGMIKGGAKWKRTGGQRAVEAFYFSESLIDLRNAHRAARNRRTGRTSGRHKASIVLTRAAIRQKLIKEKIKQVGLLNQS